MLDGDRELQLSCAAVMCPLEEMPYMTKPGCSQGRGHWMHSCISRQWSVCWDLMLRQWTPVWCGFINTELGANRLNIDHTTTELIECTCFLHKAHPSLLALATGGSTSCLLKQKVTNRIVNNTEWRTLTVEKLERDSVSQHLCALLGVMCQAIQILIALYMTMDDWKSTMTINLGVTGQFYVVEKSSNVD